MYCSITASVNGGQLSFHPPSLNRTCQPVAAPSGHVPSIESTMKLKITFSSNFSSNHNRTLQCAVRAVIHLLLAAALLVGRRLQLTNLRNEQNVLIFLMMHIVRCQIY